jgi:hypothetical protein
VDSGESTLLTVILVVGFIVLQWVIPEVLEWAIIMLISFAVIMAIYEYLIRRWNVMRFLFKIKPLLPKPAARAIKPQLGSASRPG